MLCVTIFGPSLGEIERQMRENRRFADLFEWRIDLYDKEAIEALPRLRLRYDQPIVLTLRSRHHGGSFEGESHERLAIMERLRPLEPEYIDIESDLPQEASKELRAWYPDARVLVSHHHLMGMPKEGESLAGHATPLPGDIVKFAVKVDSVLDTLMLLKAVRLAAREGHSVTGIAMGEAGESLRVLSRIMGGAMAFASPSDDFFNVYGQISGQEMATTYRYREQTPFYQAFGLIGDPVSASYGPFFHNRVLKEHGIEAVYTRFKVCEGELGDFMASLEGLPIRGFSVTMPHKEAILRYVAPGNAAAQAIGAVNTLAYDGTRWLGYNTDGVGAIAALKTVTPIEGKRVVIIGAGGTARAIAYEITSLGGLVTICNRTAERGQEVAAAFSCRFCPLENLLEVINEGVDILINTTPLGMASVAPGVSVVPECSLHSNMVVMDVVSRPTETPLVQAARAKGCRVIVGMDLFVEQALEQLRIWLQDHKRSPCTA